MNATGEDHAAVAGGVEAVQREDKVLTIRELSPVSDPQLSIGVTNWVSLDQVAA